MKSFFSVKTLIPLAMAIVVATSSVSQVQGQPVPPPAEASALPSNIVPGTPLAEVVKLIQAGVDVATIENYINNSQSPFNLDADKIIFLKDEGAPSEVINAMLDRDKVLYASTVTPQQQPAPAGPPPDNYAAGGTPDTASPSDTAPPPEDVDVNYFYNTLTPYGSWVSVDGYGRCWRPTAVNYNSTWRPYCDRGHWTYTDYGWYWDSDYAWGTTFHYGRWFRHPRFGWCWYPDTVWAPSWVTWRSADDYCGWAPLPPFAVFNPGVGFYYRGRNVGLDFDFGLGSDCFVFLPPAHFCDRRINTVCVAPQYVPQIFHRTTVINNFNVSSKTIVNRGIGVDRIASVTHRPIEPVHMSSLPNAGRQGWRGEGFQKTMQRTSAGNNNHTTVGNNNNSGRNFSTSTGNTGNTGNGQPNHGSGQFNVKDKGNPAVHYDSTTHVTQGSQQGGSQNPNYNNQVQNRSLVNGVHPIPNNQGQPQTAAYQQQQQQQAQQQQQQKTQMQTRQYNNAYNAANNGASQNPPISWQQNRNYNTPANGGVQQHGADQLQQRPSVIQPQPPANNAQQKYTEATGRNIDQPQQPAGQAVQQSQPQQHSSGNPGKGNVPAGAALRSSGKNQ